MDVSDTPAHPCTNDTSSVNGIPGWAILLWVVVSGSAITLIGLLEAQDVVTFLLVAAVFVATIIFAYVVSRPARTAVSSTTSRRQSALDEAHRQTASDAATAKPDLMVYLTLAAGYLIVLMLIAYWRVAMR